MPDVTVISAALSSLKTATDIVKFLRESDFSIEKAELKLKVADLITALAGVKLELAEVQDLITEKDRRIAELQDAFESKEQLVRRHDAYYKLGSEGNPVGVAFCLRCWEGEHLKRQLVRGAKVRGMNVCTRCGQQYEGWASEEIHPAQT